MTIANNSFIEIQKQPDSKATFEVYFLGEHKSCSVLVDQRPCKSQL